MAVDKWGGQFIAWAMTDTPETSAPVDTTPETLGAAPAAAQTAGPDVPPNHLAINPKSAFFDMDTLQRGIGIRFKGMVRTNVEEYCISEGWVRVQAGKAMDRKGQPLTIKLSGPVEAWFEDLGEDAPIHKL